MSHQSGIEVSESLGDVFRTNTQSHGKRAIVAKIQDEKIVEQKTINAQGDWKSDLALVPSLLEANAAAYVLFDKEAGANDEAGLGWILMAYVPDMAPVKDKMLYASTRATLKRQLGASYFSEEIHGTVAADFSLDGYTQWRTMKDAEAPLSMKELHRQEELELGEIYEGGAGAYVHGVAFQPSADVLPALQKVVQGSGANYCAIGVDTQGERITLVGCKQLDVAQLSGEVPLDEPRFHVFRYKHTTRGEQFDELIFVYTCPDGTGNTQPCPIKKRMLYSSSKANVQQLVERAGGQIFKSLEYNEPNDLNQADLDETLHPAPVDNIKKFAKPKRAGKGNRRLIRSPR